MFILPLHLPHLLIMKTRRQPPAPLSTATEPTCNHLALGCFGWCLPLALQWRKSMNISNLLSKLVNYCKVYQFKYQLFQYFFSTKFFTLCPMAWRYAFKSSWNFFLVGGVVRKQMEVVHFNSFFKLGNACKRLKIWGGDEVLTVTSASIQYDYIEITSHGKDCQNPISVDPRNSKFVSKSLLNSSKCFSYNNFDVVCSLLAHSTHPIPHQSNSIFFL